MATDPTTREPITVVTAFFDIGRARWLSSEGKSSNYVRSNDTYFDCFARLARMNNPFVIFCEDADAERIAAIRRDAGYAAQTTIISVPDLFAMPHVAELEREFAARMTPAFRAWVTRPDVPEYNEPKYDTIMALKSAFVKDAIDRGLVHSSQAAWVDFGFCRDDKRFDPAVPWSFDFGLRMNIFSLVRFPWLPRSVASIVRTGKVIFMGTNVVGPTDAWGRLKDEVETSLRELLRLNLADDDQTLLYMTWKRRPELFTVRYVDPSDWFVLFKRFNHPGHQLVGRDGRSLGPIAV